MDTETAQFVLIAIAAVGAVVWLIGLQFLLSTFRRDRERFPQTPEVAELGDVSPHLVAGSVEVDGEPADLSVKAAAVLAKGLAGWTPFKILERTDQRLSFENIASNVNQPGHFLREGQLRFSSAGRGRTRIDYAIGLKTGDVLFWLGIGFQGLGLAALVGGFLLLWFLVVPDPNPAVRVQVVQMVQAVHFLWPPFLVGALYRRGRNTIVSTLDLLISNLPYHAKE
jgi:hypothetical protein